MEPVWLATTRKTNFSNCWANLLISREKAMLLLRSVHWGERFDLEPLREDRRKTGGEYPQIWRLSIPLLWENKATWGVSSHAPRHGYPWKLTKHNSENQLNPIHSQISKKYRGIYPWRDFVLCRYLLERQTFIMSMQATGVCHCARSPHHLCVCGDSWVPT